MKRLYILIIGLLFFHTSTHAEDYQGYIITHSGIRLTGKISTIFHSDFGSELTFINDFGTSYQIHPALIRGFAFRNEDENNILYESRFTKGSWIFLEVIYRGKDMSLYKAPEERVSIAHGFNTIELEEYWVDVPGGNMTPLTRFRYKRRFRRLVKKSEPELARKIGKPGYRFKDLVKIIEEFNRLQQKQLYNL
ncbi:hypothetical protein [Flavilitoribacter nigricans]|uniref:DUF4369 domain-containing protein n=1 Tax=Flavilitoribacter nigricans (strain ATCC 23147 / DSM 23189 / NBRC 102662 / NCIMB 1420 / SS-2) TaxID=1122177 RepID=A0A2D0MYR8_FLAN2|nr:hypothetical protein [Flavilitoribacter nigricans]PHN01432.1 hypothetical protein CRP01_37230 [Flavilitoribacter nigricans DSM 23189 = NBRC 102662]